MTSELATAKKQLRTAIRADRRRRRDKDDQATRNRAAESLAERVGELIAREELSPGVITAYESWDVEPPTEILIERLEEAGWKVLVPITMPDLSLSWRFADQEEDLGADAIGRADLVLIPATAVDRQGYRMGQGGGCYDRTLPARRPGTLVAAIVWDEEVIDSVPIEPHDEQVEIILTPDRLIDLRSGRTT